MELTARQMSKRWPNIRPWLRVNPTTEAIDDEFQQWFFTRGRAKLPSKEVAEGYDEWADFYEFRLAQRAEELAADDHKRGLVEEWTEEIAYSARRCAAEARGEDPGEWVPQQQRRPDLHQAREARIARLMADLETRS
ncbi:hypothetical protein ALI144C_12605 [Actinosynnema sp. ALI-1.44]|uniref:hypothetical protein n=1 Tax=Actinosynnema sp. ALI-1.44 TaxID=1933779 RepID=UPI00097CBE66|nr:hypothetical protein [Actinosynnema sp. ALI-1.44]ONI85938.1 hypothetical protein ALI144C_12605 [Actinosynnema sp. ALI-1.44]